MPVAPLTNFVAGAVMDWDPTFSGNLALIRTYLGAVPAADLAANAVVRENLVRGALVPFPVDGFVSGFQGLFYETYGPGTPYVRTIDWGPWSQRITIVPDACEVDSDRKWVTPIGRTVEVYDSGTIEVRLTGAMQVTVNEDLGSPPVYPAAAGGETGGYLELLAVNRESGALTGQTESRRMVYSEPTTPEPLQMHATFGVDPGTWDVYLQYVRGTFADGRWVQIDLTNLELTLEVL